MYQKEYVGESTLMVRSTKVKLRGTLMEHLIQSTKALEGKLMLKESTTMQDGIIKESCMALRGSIFWKIGKALTIHQKLKKDSSEMVD